MKQIRTPQDVSQLGTILGVWAHPDDETFCAGGLLAAAVRNGQTVACVTATKGEHGSQDLERWTHHTLGGVRQQEMEAALQVLGIANHHWLDYADGSCHDAEEQTAAQRIRAYIDRYKPDSIITFGPEGLTGHPDHAAVSRWVSAAVRDMEDGPAIYHAVLTVDQYRNFLQTADAKMDMFFNIDQPPLVEDTHCDICLECTPSLCDCKQDALEAMPSQYEALITAFGREFLREAFRVEAFVRAK